MDVPKDKFQSWNKLSEIKRPDQNSNVSKYVLYNNNVLEIMNKIKLIINNYSFYKNQTIKLKEKISTTYYNIKDYLIQLNNLFSINTIIIDNKCQDLTIAEQVKITLKL